MKFWQINKKKSISVYETEKTDLLSLLVLRCDFDEVFV